MPRQKLPSPEDDRLNELIQAQVRAEQSAREQTRAITRQNQIEARKAQYVEDLKTEVGRLIVDVRDLTRTVEEGHKLVTALLNQVPLSDAVRESNVATQRLLDRLDDKQELILELLRFILGRVKVNGEKDRLQRRIKAIGQHPALTEESYEVEHLQQLLALQIRTLQMYELEAAQHGIDVPVSVQHGLDQARQRVAELEGQLGEIEDSGNV